ncbi:uncharacterized protein LOC101692581 isoform X1 [Mustela putorius furo]|uniref:Uncharacterized protein LOC101692581 isoform X1 n=2 Tax=Mustela TaxID=9665 RepID=A0A8U0N415_MUSPF|nr:uncharacterized protein LOC101692581 isoform X1 [Mustela putorius furo]
MSQRPQPHDKSTHPDVLPAAPSNTQKETPTSPSILHSRQANTQDSRPIPYRHQVSIQEPLPIIHNRRVSTQEPPLVNSLWAGTQDTPSVTHSHRVSTEDTPATLSSHRVSVQDAPSVSYSHHFSTQDVPPNFQTHYFNVQNSLLMTNNSLTNIESDTHSRSQASSNSHWPRHWSSHSSIQGLTPPVRAKVDVPPSITHSPTVSIKSIESVIWPSQESFKGSVDNTQSNQSTLENNIQSTQASRSKEINADRFQNRGRHSHSQLPMGWRLLHGAKKISRQLSLALSLVGMMIIGLISLGQPWIHFQVPLRPPEHPDGFLTIPINTVLFVQCPDISCLHEYDQNAYLLDFAWAFLLLASIASFCLCILLINIIFFTSSNLPVLDFSNVIISLLAGTSIILGVLFYLLQAREYLQEGMTYKLGLSFYLAWIGVFVFLMTGFFSYLNYMNFWSILALQAIWT